MRESALVKQEPAGEAEAAAAEHPGLLAAQEVKKELVVGPEPLQSPIMLALQAYKSELAAVKEEWSDLEADCFSDESDQGSCASSECSGEYLMVEPAPTASGRELDLKPCSIRIERIVLDKDCRWNRTGKALDVKSKLASEGINKTNEIDPEVQACKNLNGGHSKEPFACDFCGKQFTLRKEFMKHLSRCWKQGSKSDANKSLIRKKPYFCSYCTERFVLYSELTRHEEAHIGEKIFKCEICDKEFTLQSYLNRHMATHDAYRKGTYSCDVCRKNFACNYNLVQHMRTHTGKKCYRCNICGKQYGEKFYFKRHKLTHIPCTVSNEAQTNPSVFLCNMSLIKNELFNCDYCGKRFTIKSSLTIHRRLHTGEKPFNCDICGKQFTQKSNFRRHQATHTHWTITEGTHACDNCGRNFAFKHDLVRHMQIHSGQKVHSCDICGKRFASKNHLPRHKRTHAPLAAKDAYSCSVCKKQFAEKSNLVVHMRVHSGEKPYSCKRCGIQFTYCTSWLRHKSSHLEKGGHLRCSVCKTRFGRKAQLLDHVRRHIWTPDESGRARTRRKPTIKRLDCSVRLIPLSSQS